MFVFLDFNFYNSEKPIHTFRMEDKEIGSLSSAGSITVVEIGKLKNYNKDNPWYKLFYETDYKELKGQDIVMDTIVNDIETLNQDEKLRYTLEDKMRYEREISAQKDAANKKGEKNGILKVAKNLKKYGMSEEDIIINTGLSLEEIRKL